MVAEEDYLSMFNDLENIQYVPYLLLGTQEKRKKSYLNVNAKLLYGFVEFLVRITFSGENA